MLSTGGDFMTTVYDFDATRENGETYSLAAYQGHPLLIVNTATKCGLAPQFAGLEAIYEKYKDQGLIVLGFPSNQFKQELSDSEAAAQACRTTYGVSFPMHTINPVNGDDALPLFKFLTTNTKGAFGHAIKWNFTKFLIDADGNIVERFAPATTPEKIEPAIDALLGQSQQA
jgi:glutathione peroxidase